MVSGQMKLIEGGKYGEEKRKSKSFDNTYFLNSLSVGIIGYIAYYKCAYVFYLISRCMRPEGPLQRLAATLADSSAFLTPPKHGRILSPTTLGHTGATPSPTALPAKQREDWT